MKLERSLRVGTLNVRGLCPKCRQYQVNRLLKEKDLAVVAILDMQMESETQTGDMVRLIEARYDVCVNHVGDVWEFILFLK